MTRQSQNKSNFAQALRKLALQYPEAEEGIACKGTALETANFKARNKAFLFLGARDLMVKLGESLAEAAKLAAKEPDCYRVGANGWVKVTWQNLAPPPGLLEKWLDESYRLLAPKSLVAMLPPRGLRAPGPKKPAKRKARKKAARG